jgi:hypothetical protein
MPDIINWSENEVKTLCGLLGIKYNISGYGNVISQSIEANTLINSDSILNVELK